MKKLVSVAAVVAFTFALVGCGNNDTPAPVAQTPAATPTETPAATPAPGETAAPAETGGLLNDGNPAAITVSWWGNADRAAAMQGVIDLFEERYPHITVSAQHGEWGGWADNILQQVMAGEVADVAQVNFAWVHAWGNGVNVFQDLRDFAHIIDLSEWTPSMLDSMTTSVDGQLAGVPHGMNGRTVAYSRSLLAEFGFDHFPTTYAELEELGRAMAANNQTLDGDNNFYALLPTADIALDTMMLTMLYNATGRPMQVGGQMQHSVAEVAEAFERVGYWQEIGVIPTLAQVSGMQANESNEIWTAGRATSAFEWVSNSANQFIPNFGGGGHDADMGTAVFPNATGSNQATMQRPSLGHAIANNSQHPEVAAYFLNFMYTDEEALTILGTQLGVPFSSTAAATTPVTGAMADGLSILVNGRSGEMDAFFENDNLRNPRLAILEAFRLGTIDANTAAERFIEEQQAALNMLFN